MLCPKSSQVLGNGVWFGVFWFYWIFFFLPAGLSSCREGLLVPEPRAGLAMSDALCGQQVLLGLGERRGPRRGDGWRKAIVLGSPAHLRYAA